LIVALSGIVQRDNSPPKRHNATQKRDNAKTPERGTENPQCRPSSDLAVTGSLPELKSVLIQVRPPL
jgi:hypothetical protein